jgi:hypothetical protein
MAKDSLAELVTDLKRSTKPYPSELRERVVRCAEGLRADGLGLDRIAKRLGIAPLTLRSWLSRPVFRAVEIARAQPPKAEVVVLDPSSGLRIVGLDVVCIAELIRSLR